MPAYETTAGTPPIVTVTAFTVGADPENTMPGVTPGDAGPNPVPYSSSTSPGLTAPAGTAATPPPLLKNPGAPARRIADAPADVATEFVPATCTVPVLAS